MASCGRTEAINGAVGVAVTHHAVVVRHHLEVVVRRTRVWGRTTPKNLRMLGGPGKCAVRTLINVPAVVVMVKIVDEGAVKIGVGASGAKRPAARAG